MEEKEEYIEKNELEEEIGDGKEETIQKEKKKKKKSKNGVGRA